MPCLLPRAITPSQLSRLARCLPKRCALQVRQRHNGDTTTISSLHKTQPTVNEDGQLMRSRKHGFRSLPLSPLMRERKPSKKVSRDAADDEAMAELHKEVAMNPFAHALATPIRQCNLTFARLPSHYLLPFATIIEKSPPANKGQPPRVKAHLQPGLRSEHSGVTLGQNSYVVNRQDMVRHLSRKRHWTPLATERHKATVAQMAHRSPSASKLIEQCWVWEDKVLAAAELLEGRAVKALKEAFDVVKTDGSLPTAREERSAFALVFSDASQGENADGSSGLDSDITTYDLSALLPAETLEKLQADNNLPSSPIFIPKSASTVHAQLALDKLKAHKEANEDTKPPPRRSSPSNLAALGEGQSSEESPGSGPRPRGGVDSLMG